jgi:NADH:ubiquinone oxidoreductase subunit
MLGRSPRDGLASPDRLLWIWREGDGINARKPASADAKSTLRGFATLNSHSTWISAMKPKDFIIRFFTWWNGATLGTLVWSARHGELVGTDECGNRYYRMKGGRIDPTLGFERRWVIYKGLVDPSIIGPAWHGWIHHTVDTPPTEEKVTPRPWWKPHRPNLTGTPAAYRPTGSTLAQSRRQRRPGITRRGTPAP